MEVVVAVAGTTIMITVKAVAAMADITTTTRVRDAAAVIMITNTLKAVPAVGNIIMRMDAVVVIMTMMRNITIILINVITITKKRIKPNNNRDQGVKSKLLALFCYEY